MYTFDADVKNTTARHQCENRLCFDRRYDPSTGRFKADRPGLFYFTTSVLLSPGSAYRGQFDIRVRDAEGEMAELVCAAWGMWGWLSGGSRVGAEGYEVHRASSGVRARSMGVQMVG